MCSPLENSNHSILEEQEGEFHYCFRETQVVAVHAFKVV